MADDAELAFLNAQKEYDPATAYNPEADQESESENAYSPQDQSEESASPPQSAVQTPAAGEEGANGFKPQPATTSAEASAAPTPSKQPRTRGGFVDESEDEEEESVAQPQVGTVPTNADAPQRSITNTPNNTLPTPDVQSLSAQDQGASSLLPASVAVPESVPSVVSVPNGSAPVPDATKPTAPEHLTVASARQSAAPLTPVPTSAVSSLPKARLPQDRIGILEDRIAEDPRGDIEAWLSLIDEHRRRHKHDEARAVFERFLKTFPSSGEQWVEYIAFETELDELDKVQHLFQTAVPLAPYVPLYNAYMDFIRRRYNLNNDQSGDNRKITTQAYEFVLSQVGIDVDAGKLWVEYIEMLKTGPGVLGGTAWQDMQKMDTLRKVYQRAIAIPHGATLEIWRDYDKFEMGLNKTTGRKHLQEKSPSYMTARSAINVLDNNITQGVNRTTLPKLPPAPGFDGHDEFMNQVRLWKNWIQWEKSDPVEVAMDDRALYNSRVLHLYRNALMALRFWPELWYDAAEWCYENDLAEEGDKFLTDGIEANPESCLLAFKKANQIELRTDFEDDQDGKIAKGAAIRAPLQKLIDTMYELITQTKKREEHSIARAKEAFEAQRQADEAARAMAQIDADDEDDEEAARRQKEKEVAFNAQLQAISAGYNAQTLLLKKALTYSWIALMRAMRRVQGKGGVPGPSGGFRGIFSEARKKGRVLSDLYAASAHIEHNCYQDAAAGRILERGMKLFPDDESLALHYIKHLVKLNDATNARAVFETVVNKILAVPENLPRTRALFQYFHHYESQFGELAQIVKLEQRMATLWPNDPQLQRFAERYAGPTFDPTNVRPIVSPRTQMKPVMPNIAPSVEEPQPVAPPQLEQRLASPPPLNSPRLQNLMPVANVNSPKRPLEDFDDSAHRSKIARGESPALKGAAGRRLDAARRNLGASGNTPVIQGPTPLPRELNFVLSIIPGAHLYDAIRFSPEGIVNLLRGLNGIPMPTLPAGAGAPGQRWGTTPTTAQQLASIQEKYGAQHPGHAHTPSWG